MAVWLCEDTGGYRLSRPLDHKSLRQVGLAGIEIPSVTNYRVLFVFTVPPRLSIQKAVWLPFIDSSVFCIARH